MDAFTGEVRMFAGNFAPVNWHFCDGSLIPITQNQALFSLIGTFYGGDGRTNFGLPDLRGTFPLGFGRNKISQINYNLGQYGGSTQQHISVANLPPHTHSLQGTDQPGNTPDPSNAIFANTSGLDREYAQGVSPNVTMSPNVMSQTGNGQSLDTTPPFQALNFIICMQGIYPSRS